MIPDDPIIRSIERRGYPYWMDDFDIEIGDALDDDEPDEEDEDDEWRD